MEAWEQLGSTYVVEDPPWMTLRRDRARLPHGHEIERYWVVEQQPWVNVIAVTRSDEIVLVRQYRYAIGRASLEIPGGYAENEEPITAARRELLEETGFGNGEWSELIALAPNPALQDNWVHTFVARGVERLADPTPDDGEDLRVELFGRNAVREAVARGDIIHALHVAALLKFFLT